MIKNRKEKKERKKEALEVKWAIFHVSLLSFK
jgi:hypothetical protein